MELFKLMVLLLSFKSTFGLLKTSRFNNNTILPESEMEDFKFEDYNRYLTELDKREQVLPNLVLKFPKSLNHVNYSLTEGKITRFYEPLSPHGFFDKTFFHQLGDEVYGVTQVFGPKIEVSFRYKSGSETGKVSMLVSHKPVELQMDLGVKKGAKTCLIDSKRNSVFYMYERELSVTSSLVPDTAGDLHDDLVNEVADSWLASLYKIVMKVKFENLIRNTKRKILENKKSPTSLTHICEFVEASK